MLNYLQCGVALIDIGRGAPSAAMPSGRKPSLKGPQPPSGISSSQRPTADRGSSTLQSAAPRAFFDWARQASGPKEGCQGRVREGYTRAEVSQYHLISTLILKRALIRHRIGRQIRGGSITKLALIYRIELQPRPVSAAGYGNIHQKWPCSLLGTAKSPARDK